MLKKHKASLAWQTAKLGCAWGAIFYIMSITIPSDMASSYADLSTKMITSREQTMSSLQIAEITGRQHSNVME